MRTIFRSSALLCGLLCCLASPGFAQSSDPTGGEAEEEEATAIEERFVPAAIIADARAVASGMNAFGVELYKATAATEASNVFVSPASVSAAFGLAYAGAQGATADEIARVLHYPLGPVRFHAAMGDLLATMQLSAPGRELAVSNALWIQNELPLEQRYLDLVAARYRAGLRRVDYAADSEAARILINEWVEQQTRDRIKNLLSSLDVTPATVSVLVNTIYFKADWATPFDKAATKVEKFATGRGKVETPLMHQQLHTPYLKGDGFQAIALPYRGGETEMLVFLPNSERGLPAFEKNLNVDAVGRWIGELAKGGTRDVILTLPKFKLELRFDLIETLKGLGMTTAFSNASDFSGMKPVVASSGNSIDWNLKINNVIHQVFVEVEEKGTEAAAATAITSIIVTGSRGGPPPPPPVVFRADHPFFFALRDRRTGAILFMGRFAGPAAVN